LRLFDARGGCRWSKAANRCRFEGARRVRKFGSFITPRAARFSASTNHAPGSIRRDHSLQPLGDAPGSMLARMKGGPGSSTSPTARCRLTRDAFSYVGFGPGSPQRPDDVLAFDGPFGQVVHTLGFDQRGSWRRRGASRHNVVTVTTSATGARGGLPTGSCLLTSGCTCQNGDFRLRFSRGSLAPFCR
jgi:hypothetical protein